MQASRDIERISGYIADQSGMRASEKFIDKLNQKFLTLTQFPNIGRKRDELSSGLGSLSFEDYLILYRSTTEEVEIARVVSGYQDLEALFSSPDDQ
ncbi:type II toxin-antitoxin system RelE/ParE family toxin [Phormidesmis sp. 146-33]